MYRYGNCASGRVRVKKPHKSKARKMTAKPARAHGAQPAALQAHSTRRQPAIARPDPRHQHAARRLEPTTIYRRPNPLLIESRDDRQAFRLLLLPFVIMALVVAIVPSLHVFPTLKDLIAATPLTTVSVVTQVAELPATSPRSIVMASTPAPETAARPQAFALAQPDLNLPVARPTVGQRLEMTSLSVAASLSAMPPVFDRQHAPAPTTLSWAAPPSPIPNRVAQQQRLSPARPAFTAVATVAPVLTRPNEIAPPVIATKRETIAMLAPPRTPSLLIPLPPAPYETSCPVSYGSAGLPAEPAEEAIGSAPFGVRLADAALEQTRSFVIYDDKYRQISRAGGDVPALYGVCTDVVIRAYRALGIDLQTLVQASRLGAGDPNIDHRRTETLRRYLARYGQSLAVTPYGEDYRPGDVVTYWRPQNSGSRSHIAVVADKLGPSGRPMIIHNRGWGPQVEDALFVDRITGHYRYDGASRPPLPPQLAASPARPFTTTAPATPITLRTTRPLAAEKPNGL